MVSFNDKKEVFCVLSCFYTVIKETEMHVWLQGKHEQV